MDTYVGVWMTQYDASGNIIANYVTDRGLTAKGNTFGENTEIQIRGANVVASDQDGKTYESLAAAVASGATGVQLIADTTLDADVAIGADITLDLNGKTIDTAGFTINVTAGASTINGAGIIINSVAADDDDWHAMLDVAKGASLVITDGTFTAEGAPVASVEGMLTVNGGAFSAANAAIIVLPEGDGAALTVNGGAYKAGTTAISAIAGSNTLSVAGGDFDVPVASFDEEQAYVKYITGGTFASNPGQSTIADGKKFVQNDAGRWVLADATIASVEPLADITVAAGTDPTPQLPATVTVRLDNGLTREGVAVTWNAVPDTWKGIDGGEFTVDSATVDGSDAVTATQKVIVTAATPQGVANDGKVDITIKAGDKLELPAQLDVIWSNGQTLPADVAWEAFDAALTAKPGTFTVKGSIDAKGTMLDVAATVTVEAVPVESVAVTPAEASLTVGETVSLTATVAPDNATDKTVTWASSDEGIATVGADGMVTAVAEGAATITATADGKSATVTVTVKAKSIECTPLVFADVTAETPHRDDIDWLSCQGITEGYDNGDGTVDFGGMRTVVRQDMAAFLKRLADYQQADPSLGEMHGFTDVNAVTPHADDIKWLARTGVTSGYEDGSFGPMRSVVRQDMAAFLHRMSTNVLGK